MNVYEVTYENHTLYFIAENQDHLLTLVSQMLGTCDYSNLINRLAIKRVSGTNFNDGLHFYLGLINDSRY